MFNFFLLCKKTMITGHVMQIFGIKSEQWFKVIKLYLAV